MRSVPFNFADPYEVKLSNYADKQGRFATYVKRLIQRDMEGGNAETQAVVAFEAPKEEAFSDDLAGMLL
jgi:hypothetical protein